MAYMGRLGNAPHLYLTSLVFCRRFRRQPLIRWNPPAPRPLDQEPSAKDDVPIRESWTRGTQLLHGQVKHRDFLGQAEMW